MTTHTHKSSCPKCCPEQCYNCPVHYSESDSQEPMSCKSSGHSRERNKDRHNKRGKERTRDKSLSKKRKKSKHKEDTPPPSPPTPPIPLHNPRHCPSHSEIKNDDDVRIALTLPVAIQIMKNWCIDVTYEIDDALYDVKCIWTSTDSDLSKKLCATNRLFIYYLLIMAIYIIQICFMIDEKLFEGLCKIFSSINERK